MMLELVKEMYEREIKRRDSLTSSQNLSLLGISLVGSLLFALIQNASSPSILAKIIVCLVYVCLAFALFHFIRSLSNFFFGHCYREHAAPKDILEYQRQNTEPGSTESSLFEKAFEDELAECASHNFEINNKRTEQLAMCKSGLVAAFLLLNLLIIEWLIHWLIS